MLGGEAVEAGVEDQRLPAGRLVGLDLAEEDHVVAGVDAAGTTADEVRDGAFEHGRAVAGHRHPLELVAARGGELPRQVVLVGGEHVDREPVGLLERRE